MDEPSRPISIQRCLPKACRGGRKYLLPEGGTPHGQPSPKGCSFDFAGGTSIEPPRQTLKGPSELCLSSGSSFLIGMLIISLLIHEWPQDWGEPYRHVWGGCSDSGARREATVAQAQFGSSRFETGLSTVHTVDVCHSGRDGTC